MVVSYGLQFNVLLSAGKQPAIVLTDIDPKTAMMGSLPFALLRVLSNFVNSFMEEGLFRGVMLRHFRTSLSFWQANFLQAALFALWHLVYQSKITSQGKPI